MLRIESYSPPFGEREVPVGVFLSFPSHPYAQCGGEVCPCVVQMGRLHREGRPGIPRSRSHDG